MEKTIGPYEVEELIGQGPHGKVYRVVGDLAVKWLTGPLSPRQLRRWQRWLEEERPAGVVPIVAHGMHEGTPWFATELLGPGLQSTLAGRPKEEIVRPMAGLLATLVRLHERGRAHGNLKPSNLLTRGDEVVVTDPLPVPHPYVYRDDLRAFAYIYMSLFPGRAPDSLQQILGPPLRQEPTSARQVLERLEVEIPDLPAAIGAPPSEPLMVGRRKLVSQIYKVLEEVGVSRELRVLQVVGEAGLGKTMLIRQLLRPLEGAGLTWVMRQVSASDPGLALADLEALDAAVVFLDDLDRGDEDAVEAVRAWLLRTAPRLSCGRVVLITSRTPLTLPHAETAVLQKLDADEVRLLASSMIGEPASEPGCEWLLEQSAGVPAHVASLIFSYGGVPERVETDALETVRISRLSSQEARLLRLLATAPAPPTWEQLQSASEMAEPAFTDAVDSLRERHLAAVHRLHSGSEQERLTLYHESLRDTVLGGLSEEQRQTLLLQWANEWSRLDEGAALQAYCLEMAGRRVEAVPAWLTAARRGVEMRAYTRARRLFRKVLDSGGNPALIDAARHDLAEMETHAQDVESAEATYQELLASAPTPLHKAALLRKQASLFGLARHFEDALDTYEGVARLLHISPIRQSFLADVQGSLEAAWTSARAWPARREERDRLHQTSDLLHDVAQLYLDMPAPHREAISPALFLRLKALGRRADEPLMRSRSWLQAAGAALLDGPAAPWSRTAPAIAEHAIEEGVHAADDVRDTALRASLYEIAARRYLAFCGDLDRAEHCGRLARNADPSSEASVCITLAWVYLLEGDVQQAGPAARAAEAAPLKEDAACGHALVSMVAQLSGQATVAERSLEEAPPLRESRDAENGEVARAPVWMAEGTLAMARGLVAWFKGNVAVAGAEYGRALDHFEQAGLGDFFPAWAASCLIDVSLEEVERGHSSRLDPARCRRLLARHRAVRRFSQLLEGITCRQQGRLLAMDGRREQALSRFARSIELLDHTSPLEAARTHVERGKWRIRWGLQRGKHDLELASEVFNDRHILAEEVRTMRLLGMAPTDL